MPGMGMGMGGMGMAGMMGMGMMGADGSFPLCGQCGQPVTGQCVTALEQSWHPEHFICTKCCKPFDNQQFFELDGKPYCDACMQDAAAPKCQQCGNAITGKCVTIQSGKFHSECFK